MRGQKVRGLIDHGEWLIATELSLCVQQESHGALFRKRQGLG
jgi:hypothetical protein